MTAPTHDPRPPGASLPPLRVALVQDDPTVGAVADNRARMLARLEEARALGAHLVVFPELATLGYPPRDLLDLPDIVDGNLETVRALAQAAGDLGVLVGYVDRRAALAGLPLANVVGLLTQGRVVHTWDKALLPNYDVFDEARYFEPSTGTSVATFRGWRLGVSVCEDLWALDQDAPRARYARSPIAEQAAAGVDLLVNVSASPYVLGKLASRRRLARRATQLARAPFLYCNQLGANDDLLFDGASFGLDADGRLVLQLPAFQTGLALVTLGGAPQPEVPAPAEGLPTLRDALVMGIRDYVHKSGFRSVVLGLSGGIDSAVTCALAVRALGPDNVLGVLMPSPHSSRHSVDDALALAANLGIQTHTVPIGPLMQGFDQALAPIFGDRPPGLAEENLQARIRGTLLMGISNKLGHLLLTTGNKSELAVGYCTLYGDMNGGLAPLSDLPKTLVYALAHQLNADGPVIPSSSIDKPPSAELRPDQTDQDSLPPYDELDAILRAYVEEHRPQRDIASDGHDPALVARVVDMIHLSEYKRRQAAPGLKITPKAFGVGRRFPIAHRWR